MLRNFILTQGSANYIDYIGVVFININETDCQMPIMVIWIFVVYKFSILIFYTMWLAMGKQISSIMEVIVLFSCRVLSIAATHCDLVWAF